MRVSIGPVADIAEGTCTAIADGVAVVVRTGNEVRAFRNRCLHQDSPLEGGWVRKGILSCPLHFWRYRVSDGTHVGTDGVLDQFPVEVVDGDVFITLPDPEPPRSLREQLLERAHSYDRSDAYDQTTGNR